MYTDNQVRVWEVAGNGQTVPKASQSMSQPILCGAWSHDGAAYYCGGADKSARRWDLASNTFVQVAAHDAPVRCCAWVPEHNLLLTGSWDKTLKYWDPRQSSGTPALSVALPERCYSLSLAHPLLVVTVAEYTKPGQPANSSRGESILVYNLQNPQQVYKTVMSPLKYQLRCCACFPDKTGFLVGSIEGRVAVQHVEDNLKDKNFTFKCHRNNEEIYSVNSLCFHPTLGTFATTGSDGAYNYWDKDSKQRLKSLKDRYNQPISASCFNKDGSIFAYAVSYDWSKGADAYAQGTPNRILLHAVQESEIKAKPRTNRR